MKTTIGYRAAAFMLVLLAAAPAFAQNGDGNRNPEQMLAEFQQRNGNGILDEDIEALTAAQMIQRGRDKLDGMQVTLEGTGELLDRARGQERDILKINCINENLASIKGFVNVAEQSYESLQTSAEADDEEATRHHYTLISIAGQRVTSLGEQARVCAGEELRYAEDASLEVTIDPNIGDPDKGFIDDDSILDRPAKVSPFK